MSNGKTQRTGPDRSRAAMSENVVYWTKRFEVSRDRLEEAVDRVGNSADAVGEFLSR